MDYTVDKRLDGKTVLDVLKKELGLSHALIKHLKFAEDGILLNGKHVTVRKILSVGDVLSLALEDKETPDDLTPSDIPLSILYEDEDVIIPNKPPNMPTHPSHGHYDDTLANALAFRYAKAGIPFVFRPVNRLDRNTSGAVVIAKNRISAAFLSEALRHGEIRKTYIAVLDGVPNQAQGKIENHMRRTDESIIVRRVCADGEEGDYALTYYTLLLSNENNSIVLASPITGRTHQLRVHFASIGCPVTGDDMYGKGSPLIDRHALHAVGLTLPLLKGNTINLYAPLHDDMQELAQKLFSITEQELFSLLSKGEKELKSYTNKE